MDKIFALELPVLFQYPVNAGPNECKSALEAYERDNQNISYFNGHGYLVKNLEGIHTWRKAGTGEEMVTAGIHNTFWGNSWYLRPSEITVNNRWDGVGGIHDGCFYIHHWVLCDDLPEEKYQEWEALRRIGRAQRRARSHSEPIQLEF